MSERNTSSRFQERYFCGRPVGYHPFASHSQLCTPTGGPSCQLTPFQATPSRVSFITLNAGNISVCGHDCAHHSIYMTPDANNQPSHRLLINCNLLSRCLIFITYHRDAHQNREIDSEISHKPILDTGDLTTSSVWRQV